MLVCDEESFVCHKQIFVCDEECFVLPQTNVGLRRRRFCLLQTNIRLRRRMFCLPQTNIRLRRRRVLFAANRSLSPIDISSRPTLFTRSDKSLLLMRYRPPGGGMWYQQFILRAFAQHTTAVVAGIAVGQLAAAALDAGESAIAAA